jgi:hypothetical protein
MTKTEFMRIWSSLTEDEETRGYIPSDRDKFVQISGYLFAVQESGNVIMKKCGESRFTLYEVFRAFRIWLKMQEIQYIRVEGTKNRYQFLSKMFPNTSILKDTEEKIRNVYYIKVFD